jgi:REP element-mobilizing transposase RayT
VPAIGRRRLTRLQEHNYAAPGAYFVTVCTLHKEPILGEIACDSVVLSPAGAIVDEAWHDLSEHYPHLRLDAFVIMPNHIHGILFLSGPPLPDSVGAGLRPAPTHPDDTTASRRHGLSEIIRAFKSFSARRINALRGTPGLPVWQRGFYDHVIRNDEDLARIRQYIITNPLRWSLDEENPHARL